MMEWRDEGAVLSLRPHGESAAIVEIFTRDHGRHFGLVRGGASRRMAAHLQPGTQVQAVWKARLGDHIGAFTVEPQRSRAHLLSDRAGLAGLLAICALLARGLPERAPQPGLWAETIRMLDLLGRPDWPSAYLRWEMTLLAEIGFGLDLMSCAVTGTSEDLSHVSPRTGRAVSRGAVGEWSDRLLPLPAGLAGQGALSPPALLQGLALTGHFLARELGAEGPAPLPAARGRLIDLWVREAHPKDAAR